MIRPRVWVHRGSIEARAFLIETPLIGEEEARRRVLKLWEPRADVHRIDEGYLIFLPAVRRVHAEAAPGTPLVEIEGRYCSAPLEEDELAAIPKADSSVVLVRGGRALVSELDSTNRVDPSTWIDLEAFIVLEVSSLGEKPPPPKVAFEVVSANFVREGLADVPPLSAEAKQAWKEIFEADPKTSTSSSEQGESFFRQFAGKLLQRLASLLAPKPVAGGGGGTRSRELVQIAGDPPPQGFFARLSRKLQKLAGELLRLDTLRRMVSAKHANYLSKMMEMFESGDLKQALHHAIPLHGESEGNSSPTFSPFSPRSELAISGKRASGGPAVGLGGGLYEEMRRLYRRAFERLEREGRIEEAAFVLAELLQASEEAVTFLERHEKFELAAKLAESRELAPGLVVRQWFLAKNVARAVLIARRSGAFADAISRLGSKHAGAAKALRLLWANALAEAGDYGAAVETIWNVKEARHLVEVWIDAGLAAGGPPSARMMVRALALRPERFEQIKQLALAMLEDTSFEQMSSRTALAHALMNEPASPMTRLLARATMRAVLRDEARWSASLTRRDAKTLMNFANDGALRTDVPPRTPELELPLLTKLEHPRYFRFSANDGGALRIADAVLLPSGKILVALGEIGVRYLANDGRTLATFDVPAENLVVSDKGDRVITLSERGEVTHLGRIDLVFRRATSWCDLSLTGFAPDFDGSIWFVCSEKTLLGLDATSRKKEALWSLPKCSVYLLARTEQTLVSVNADEDELWTHDLTKMVLRERKKLPVPLPDLLLPDGSGVFAGEPDEILYFQGTHFRSIARPADLARLSLAYVALSKLWFAAGAVAAAGIVVTLIELATGKERARFELDGAQQCSLRLDERTLVIGDSRGRVIVFDHQHGRILRILRLI
jgi:hypothetical protein